MYRYMDFLEFSTTIVKFLGFYSNVSKIRTVADHYTQSICRPLYQTSSNMTTKSLLCQVFGQIYGAACHSLSVNPDYLEF